MEPLNITSGLTALLTCGLQAGENLYHAIGTVKGHSKFSRDLRREVQDVATIFLQLRDAIAPGNEADLEADLVALKVPVYSCALTCLKFQILINNCTKSTTDNHRYVRDWTNLQLKGSEINSLRAALSSYKSTVQITLGKINLKMSRLTLECLEYYEELIQDTKDDLEDHLYRIESELLQGISPSMRSPSALPLGRPLEEKEITIICLDICEEVSKLIERHQATSLRKLLISSDTVDTATSNTSGGPPSAHLVASALSECLKSTTAAEKTLRDRTLAVLRESPNLANQSIIAESIRVRECLLLVDAASRDADIARTKLVKDEYADDSRIIMVSTVDDLISAKRVMTG